MAKQSRGYTRLQIALHWIIAALVLFQLVFNEAIEEAFDDRIDGGMPVPAEEVGAWLHVAAGVAILVLALVRIAVRVRHGVPAVPREHPAPLRWIASATHYLLYGFIIGMPLVGAAAWFGGIEAAGAVHSAARFILVPLIVLHAAGALVEHFVLRTNVLRRMLVPEKR
jgi:cytochrome b561